MESVLARFHFAVCSGMMAVLISVIYQSTIYFILIMIFPLSFNMKYINDKIN